MMIWAVLAALMLAKVGVSFLGMAQWMAITLLVLISLVSALLVALYYMHLRFEPKKLWVLAFIPIPLIFILILFVIQDFG
jgi:cytochrome c oxidase subunit 4